VTAVVKETPLEDVMNVVQECISMIILNANKSRLWVVFKRTLKENASIVLLVYILVIFRFRFE